MFEYPISTTSASQILPPTQGLADATIEGTPPDSSANVSNAIGGQTPVTVAPSSGISVPPFAMPTASPLFVADREQMAQFYDALFRYADPDSIVSLRAFKGDTKPAHYGLWVSLPAGEPDAVLDAAERLRSRLGARLHRRTGRSRIHSKALTPGNRPG